MITEADHSSIFVFTSFISFWMSFRFVCPPLLLRSSYCSFFFIGMSFSYNLFTHCMVQVFFLLWNVPFHVIIFWHAKVCFHTMRCVPGFSFLWSFSIPLYSLFPSFLKSYFPLQNFNGSSVWCSVILLLRFSTSVLLESVISGDPLCQILNSYISYCVSGVSYSVRVIFFRCIHFNKNTGKVVPIQKRERHRQSHVIRRWGTKGCCSLERPILWFLD